MIKNKTGVMFLAIVVALSIINAGIAGSYESDLSRSYQTIGSASFNTQYSLPGFSSGAGYTSPSVYWPEFDRDTCRERQDFIVQVAPAGCEPAVVRSDLLEERNVPVFCKLMLVQTNPLIDVSRVKSITFSGERPEEVAGVTYYPSNVNLRDKRNLADTPIDDNMGYFVLNLKKYKTEDEMPEWIEGNLTAVINYDIENALGMGRTFFYLSELDGEEWARDYRQYGFWNSKAYVKVDSIESGQAVVSIYRDADTRISTMTLKKGETSETVYLPGFYCTAGLKVKVEEIQAPKEAALLQVDDQQIWVAAGDQFADGKCRVKNVDATSGGGKISVSCSSAGSFDLRLSPGKIKLKVQKENATLESDFYNVGSEVVEGGQIYLGYIGSWGKGDEKEKFAILISDANSDSEAEFTDKNIFSVVEKVIEDAKEDETFEKLAVEIKEKISSQYSKEKAKLEKDKIAILLENDEPDSNKGKAELVSGDMEKVIYTFQLAEITTVENHDWEEEGQIDEQTAYEYYKKAKDNYVDLADFYPNDKRIENESFEPYAAEGLYDASILAKNFNMTEDQEEFLSRLYRQYPDSAWTREAEKEKERLLKYDSTESRAVVYSKTYSYFIQLLDFSKPKKEDVNANLMINGNEEVLGLNEVWEDGTGGVKGSFKITEIDDKFIRIEYERSDLKETKKAKLDLVSNQQVVFDAPASASQNLKIKLLNINLKKQVKLNLDSEVKETRAYANFSFKVGIEKRGIQLSPEKTQEMIKNLEESIEKWENINEKLGNIVQGLKTTCFATAAILNIKNLVTGFSGEALARNQIMTQAGGWNDYCERIASSGEASKVNGKSYATPESCLVGHNSYIEDDIKIYSEQIKNTNEKLAQARQGLVEHTDFLDIEGQVTDRMTMEGNFKDIVSGDCASWGEIELPKIGTTSSTFDPSKYGFCGAEGTGRFEDTKDIYTIQNTLDAGGSQVLNDMLTTERASTALSARDYQEWDLARKKASEAATQLGMKPTYLEGEKYVLGDIHTVKESDVGGLDKIPAQTAVVAVSMPNSFTDTKSKERTFYDLGRLGGQVVLVEVKDTGKDGVYSLDSTAKIYTQNGELIGDGSSKNEDYEKVKAYLSYKDANRFKQADKEAYNNKMVNTDKLQVKYFDKAPYKGLPAEVPFDIQEGWYVEMEYVTSGFGKPYDESGRVANFYICNVGSNGLIEFKRKSDDICRYYNGISSDLDFPGMDTSDSKKLVSRAMSAIRDAAKDYGKPTTNINGLEFETGTSFGGDAGRCSDFMSPKDCQLMFNVCDPVICPSSRCDLGGAFPVDNVVQTGIIGSIVLCLPNINEGIYIPVCLSGIHAGIDSFLSILKAERECLNESLETGRNIGICDEITSIYKCEFFWRQLVPFMDILIPKLIEGFYSQGTRGGGEYLTVQSAWENTEKSIDYFKDEYAVNSMQAYNMRSTEQAGTEVCKAFISSSFPTDFDLLTEPDSPVQFTAYFDENVMTTATPYPTSHYKVYYHIYAGKDQGAYYVVYLKDISQEFLSSYTYASERYVIPGGRGYITKGDFVDEAKDFTGPSGYKQLCININGQDYCDFGKVSTNYAVNWISDKYAEEQAKEQVTTSEECIAGSSSLWSLAQPNIQAGTEEFVEPELYNQGIVRVCSTYNPGKQVDSKGDYDTTNSTFDRWKDIGHCDDETIRCWLDTDSVKQVINNKDLEKEVLDSVDTSAITSGYLTYEESRAIANEAYKFIKGLNIVQKTSASAVEDKIGAQVKELEKLARLGPSNPHRAEGLFLLGKLYKKTVEGVLGVDGKVATATTTAPKVDAVIPAKGTTEPIASSYEAEGYYLDDEGRIWEEGGIDTFLRLNKEKGKIILNQGDQEFIIGDIKDNQLKFNMDSVYVRNYATSEAEELEGAKISGDTITLVGETGGEAGGGGEEETTEEKTEYEKCGECLKDTSKLYCKISGKCVKSVSGPDAAVNCDANEHAIYSFSGGKSCEALNYNNCRECVEADLIWCLHLGRACSNTCRVEAGNTGEVYVDAVENCPAED